MVGDIAIQNPAATIIQAKKGPSNPVDLEELLDSQKREKGACVVAFFKKNVGQFVLTTLV